MTKFVGLRARFYSYLTDGGREGKKAKDTKNCAIKRKLKYKNYKISLEATPLENKLCYTDKK